MAAGLSERVHRCLSEDQLLELALGGMSQPAALELLREVELCADCSLVLAEAGRAVARNSQSDAHEPSPLEGFFRGVRVGDVLGGRFRIVRALGAGGMGEVYEALDVELGERLALKTIRAGLSSVDTRVERFKQEVRLARRVLHPNVCRVLEFGRHELPAGPCYFLTMELLSGELLSERLRRRGPLPVSEALSIAQDLCAGLAAIHAEGILHRDIKTNNVMLCVRAAQASEAPAERAVLLDFGIARPVESRDTPLTAQGVIGTPEYMAPEQLRGEALSPAADVYALGVVLFELLAGRLPFVGDGTLAPILKRLEAEPARPSAYVPGLPASLDELVVWCLDKRPEGRPSLAELSKLLPALRADTGALPARHGVVVNAPTAEATPALVVPLAHGRPRPVGRWLGATALLVVLVVLAASWWLRAPAPRGVSRAEAVLARPALPEAMPEQLAESARPSTAPPAASEAVREHVTHKAEPRARPVSTAPRTPERSRPQRRPTSAPDVAPRKVAPTSASCSPPYYYDERGLRIYRPDCL